MKKHTGLLLLLLITNHIYSQSATFFDNNQNETNVATELYGERLRENVGLINGRRYYGYSHQVSTGTPFLESVSFVNGSILYDGGFYNDIPVNYDVVADKVITKSLHSGFVWSLINERVKAFSLLNRRFIRITAEAYNGALRTGYYEVLYEGNKSTALKRTSKVIKEDHTAQQIRHAIYDEIDYYLVVDNEVHKIKRRRDILNAYADKKKDVQVFIKSNKIRTKNNLSEAMKKIASFYETAN